MFWLFKCGFALTCYITGIREYVFLIVLYCTFLVNKYTVQGFLGYYEFVCLCSALFTCLLRCNAVFCNAGFGYICGTHMNINLREKCKVWGADCIGEPALCTCICLYYCAVERSVPWTIQCVKTWRKVKLCMRVTHQIQNIDDVRDGWAKQKVYRFWTCYIHTTTLSLFHFTL